jgi:hypothetical protein
MLLKRQCARQRALKEAVGGPVKEPFCAPPKCLGIHLYCFYTSIPLYCIYTSIPPKCLGIHLYCSLPAPAPASTPSLPLPGSPPPRRCNPCPLRPAPLELLLPPPAASPPPPPHHCRTRPVGLLESRFQVFLRAKSVGINTENRRNKTVNGNICGLLT